MQQKTSKWMRKISTILLISLVSASTISAVSANPETIVPRFTSAVASSSQINTSDINSRIIVSFMLDNEANVKLEIRDAFTNKIIKTIFGDNYGGNNLRPPLAAATGQAYNMEWNGRDDNGNIVFPTGNPSPAYLFYLEASNKLTNAVTDIRTGVLTVINNNNGGACAIPHLSNLTSPTFDFNTMASISLPFTVDQQAEVSVKIYDQFNNLVRTLFQPVQPPLQAVFLMPKNNNFIWDGKSNNGNAVTNGTYKYEMTASSKVGCGSDTQVGSITVINANNNNNFNAPVVSQVFASPNFINTNNNETTSIHYNLANHVDNVTVKIIQGGSIIRTFSGSIFANDNIVIWDGRNSNGSIVTGFFDYTVTASNFNNNTVGTGFSPVQIQVNNFGNNNIGQPQISNVYTTPTTFNPNNGGTTQVHYYLDRPAQVTVQVLNNNNNSIYAFNNILRTLTDRVNQSSGDHFISWNGIDSSGNMVPNGTYTLRVDAFNNSGSDIESTTVQVNRSGYYYGGGNMDGDIIQNLIVTPTIFNPNNGQSTSINYNLARNATVTVQLLDSNRNVIRTLVDHVSRYGSNNNTFNNSLYTFADSWNGRDKNGYIYDGVYQVRITAYSYDNNVTDTETAYVEVNIDGNVRGIPTTGTSGTVCANFSDVFSTNRYCKAIQLMKEKGIFEGYTDGTFRPYQQITRAEATKVIELALNIPIDDNNFYYGTSFTDVSNNSWYRKYIDIGARLGIITGYPDLTFRPNQTINRVELLKIFLESSGLNIPYCSNAPFRDTPITEDTRWYMNHVCFAKSNQLMSDDGRGRFNPTTPMTRGDVADLFYQFDKRGLSGQINPPQLYQAYTWDN